MVLFLTLVSGLAWTIVYFDCIRVGLRDRTYAMPMAALALNIAWESIYAFRGLADGGSVQAVINLVWALADLVIVSTFLRFGRAEFPAFVTRSMFLCWGALVLVAAYALQLLFIGQFGAESAARYSAFLQNALMSGLFIAMLVARGSLRGQSVTIAAAKWLGTLAPTILFGVIEGSALVLGLGIICCVFDLVYLALVVWAARRPEVLAARGTRTRFSAVAG